MSFIRVDIDENEYTDRNKVLDELAHRLTYKPGWEFSVEGLDTERPRLVIKAAVLHSELLTPVVFYVKRLVPHFARCNTEHFVEWVKDMLEEAEVHEMREFFRFDGKLVDSPHATETVKGNHT